MSTLTQCLKSYRRIKKLNHSRTFKLRKQPHVLVTVVSIITKNPKKPNSGKRRVLRGNISNLKRSDRLTARLTSYGVFPKRGDHVLIRGGRANDVPGVTYSGIRGVFNFQPHSIRRKRRSFYGNPRSVEMITRISKRARLAGFRTPEDVINARIKLTRRGKRVVK